MRPFRRFSVAAFAATIAMVGTACQHDSTAPQMDATDVSASSSGALVLSVRGSGQATTPLPGIPPAEVEGLRTFSFTAHLWEDGTATGRVQYNSRNEPSALQQGRIFCVNAIGEGLYAVAAEATHRVADQAPGAFPGLPPAVVGVDHGFLFAVRDNGEGANATGPDQITATINTTLAVAGAICQYPAALGFTPAVVETFLADVEGGNIQVN